MLKILAIIPAREGSKRVPKKNARMLASKPLLNWSIEAVKDIDCVVDILVSTDSTEIAKIATDAGALVPWLRPAELATDTASSVDVCLHALDWYEAHKEVVNGVLLLQPTSPFRSKSSIQQSLEMYSKNRPCSVIGVSSVHHHPAWCFKIKNDRLEPWASADNLHLRSQDLESVYTINGSIYLISPHLLRQEQAFYVTKAKTLPFIMDGLFEAIDIDTERDWILAELIAMYGHNLQ